MRVTVFVAADCESLPGAERFFDEFVALDPPDFRTIRHFRKRHLKALAALCSCKF